MPSPPAEDQGNRFPNTATPPGSAPYYAVRFAPVARRDALALLLLWYAEIRAMATAPRDPGVMRLKLDWWRQELGRLEDAEPRHPITVGLRDNAVTASTQVEPMRAVIDATEDEIAAPQCASDDDFVDACRRTGGALHAALTRAETNADTAPASLHHVGAYCEGVERIRTAGQHPHRLPTDVAQLIQRGGNDDALAVRCATLLDALRQPLSEAPPRQGISARLGALHRALHDKMHRLDYPVGRQRVERPPLGHLWTAWRSR
jgi:phytoene synthase